jgi:hypothetical protein
MSKILANQTPFNPGRSGKDSMLVLMHATRECVREGGGREGECVIWRGARGEGEGRAHSMVSDDLRACFVHLVFDLLYVRILRKVRPLPVLGGCKDLSLSPAHHSCSCPCHAFRCVGTMEPHAGHPQAHGELRPWGEGRGGVSFVTTLWENVHTRDCCISLPPSARALAKTGTQCTNGGSPAPILLDPQLHLRIQSKIAHASVVSKALRC